MAAVSTSVSIDVGADTGSQSAPATELYTVQRGDTLYSIAKRYGTTVEDLTARNQLASPTAIRAGQVLVVPTGMASVVQPLTEAPGLDLQAGAVNMQYTVVSGDTLNSIARRFGASASTLAAVNGISNPNLINIGQVILVPLSTRSGLDTGATAAAPPNIVVDTPLQAPGGAPVPTQPSPIVPTTPTTSPYPPPTGPLTAGTLPIALFGSAASDQARLALIPSFDRWADAYGVPRDLVKGLAFVESGWRANALSSAGAVGIGQLMPDTSRWLATTIMNTPTLDPTNPDDNIRMTARYLRYLLDNSGGDETTAIGSYYQGIGSVRRDGMKPVTVTYVQKVQAARAHFR